jgi:deazaflavin-dependent oxidoreductase (nitroreductase family)
MARVLHHADTFMLRLSDGKMSFAQFSGLPVIELTTIGAKSGVERTLPLAGFLDGDKYVLVASNFGGSRHPAWYYNLKAHPRCTVREKGEAREYFAQETDGEQRERYWKMAVSYYLGYEAYRRRAGDRRIPVMVLEPKDSPTDSR